MSAIAVRTPRPLTLLKLGRVSNLPTVWTNVVAGAVVASASAKPEWLLQVGLAMTAFYVGGMYLNDYFDREIDARERPDRPICAGDISADSVRAIGFGLLVLGVLLMAPFGMTAAVWGVALGAVIVLYDLWHKGNAFGPVIMSACRALVYCGAGVAISGTLHPALILWAVVLAAHVVGLTYAAKQESLNQIGSLWPLAALAVPLIAALASLSHGWPLVLCLALLALVDIYAVRLLMERSAPGAVPRAVSVLIAAISIVDALVVSANGGGIALVAACIAGFVLTRLFQKLVPGT